MQARKTVQGKIVEKKIVCRTDEQIKLVQKLVKENCSSVRGFNTKRDHLSNQLRTQGLAGMGSEANFFSSEIDFSLCHLRESKILA